MLRMRQHEPVRRPTLHHAPIGIDAVQRLHRVVDLADAQRDRRNVVLRASAGSDRGRLLRQLERLHPSPASMRSVYRSVRS